MPSAQASPLADPDGAASGARPSARERPCPLCGRPLYPWIALPRREAEASVGLPLSEPPGAERILERCEGCGCALEQGVEIDAASEWAALRSGPDTVRMPNRASLQAAIGVQGWAALPEAPGDLLLTPRSLSLLAEKAGREIGALRTPPSGRAQVWMWQTLLNGLTFHPNFLRRVRAGRLRPSNARNRLAFAADSVVTALAGPLALLVSAPLELLAALFRRGGEIEATVIGGGE